MSLNLSAIAVRERAVTLFFILLLAAVGAYAFVMLGRAEDPNFTIKTLTVTTAWPGATAREMQDLVAEPLEKRLQELTWYDRVETTTRPGYAYMTVTLKDSTPPSVVQEEFYQARKKLGDEARNLPSGVLGPFVNDEYSDVSFALYALKAKGMAPYVNDAIHGYYPRWALMASIWKAGGKQVVIDIDNLQDNAWKADAVLKGQQPQTNNTTDYNNGKKVVPSMLLQSVVVDKSNYQKALVDTGYYTQAQLG